MKSFALHSFIVFFLTSGICFGQEYLGTYVTKPEVVPGFIEPYSESVKNAMERMTWRMEISENEISILMGSIKEEIVMEYSSDGDYLLAREENTAIRKYVPFYVKDAETIHGFGTVFFRAE